jgi:hypothetical protein
VSIDRDKFEHDGWVPVRRAIPEELCRGLVGVLELELRVPVDDPPGGPNMEVRCAT